MTNTWAFCLQIKFEAAPSQQTITQFQYDVTGTVFAAIGQSWWLGFRRLNKRAGPRAATGWDISNWMHGGTKTRETS
jgi:hypothetical protein